MIKRYPPISDRFPRMFHGGDYNPDQWLKRPDILEDDIRLMKLASCNAMTVGIFAWAALEPAEGRYDFGWLDRTMDSLARAKIYAILATPSGARPAWMSQKYAEVSRVNESRVRELHGCRHNHCYTSPVYREKAAAVNEKLAERYSDHPALILWHVSNEYGGECHCGLCQNAFRAWLKAKYGTIEALNDAWWTSFWSHTFTDFGQIESPTRRGEFLIHGHNLDWKRFVTDQTLDFMKHEIAPLKKIAPRIPVTTNMMGTYPGLNYRKLAGALDVISWDSYPRWHSQEADWKIGADCAFVHDLNRSLGSGKPFLMMESSPSVTNWQPVPRLKRPGMHFLSSIQAVAHGADSVQYFQWRKGRGGCEKFHGAVVDHAGHENTRVFGEVAQVGEALSALGDIAGSSVPSEVAVIFDWENRWAIEDSKGPGNNGRKLYEETCKAHYYPFWQNGIPVDVIGCEDDFAKYKLIIAPMLYMIKPGVASRLETFVRKGGILVCTYLSGITDENDLCFLGGQPGPIAELLGIWVEEIDCLYPQDKNRIVPSGSSSGLSGEYEAVDFCELVHTRGASVLAAYGADFYRGAPALTSKKSGAGEAFYICSRNDGRFQGDFYATLSARLGLKTALLDGYSLPEGVTAQVRAAEEKAYVFVSNFSGSEKSVALGKGSYVNKLTGNKISGNLNLAPYGCLILERSAQ